MYYIVAGKKYFPVANLLREIMQEKLRSRILITRKELPIRRYGKIILNVGTSFPWVENYFLNHKIINLPMFCRISGNKLRTYDTFRNYIPMVEYYYGIPESFPVIKREDLNGFHGKGVQYVKTQEEFGEYPTWYSSFINFSAEYRLFLLVLNQEIKLQRLFKKAECEDSIIKNAEHCHYYYISTPKLSKLSEFVSNFLSRMFDIGFNDFYVGLDIGRVGRDLILIETNSAPGMNSITAELFVNTYIKEVINA